MTRIHEIAQSKSSLGSNDVLMLEDGSDNLITKKISGAALLASAASSAPVQSVAGKTGAVSLASGDITGLVASATTDTTNASNITSGTLAAARLPAVNLGTTSVDLTRASGSLSLTGISIDGNAGTVTNGVYTTGSYSDPSWLTISKSKVGLGNVENTALSTWAGSTNITTLGTITTGTVPIANVSGGAPLASPTFTGVATVPAGTASAPSIQVGTTAGSNKPGIYSPGADQVALATGGTGRVFVDASGNVGIGTSSPGAKLHIYQNTNTSGGIAIQNTVRNYYLGLTGAVTGDYLFYDSTNSQAVYTYLNTSGHIFYSSGTERLRIDSSGRLLVGTSGSTGVAGNGVRIVSNAVGTGYDNTALMLNGTGGDFYAIGFQSASMGIVAVQSASPNYLAFGSTGTGQVLQIGAAGAIRFAAISTTASAANAFLDSGNSNNLLRSTSSLRYKTDVEDLDHAKADALLKFRPVWYRSKANADKKEWSWYGLIAEEVAEIEPRLVHWTYLDEDYEEAKSKEGITERKLKAGAKLVPDGVQYDRLTVLLLDVVQRQQKSIESLEATVATLTS